MQDVLANATGTATILMKMKEGTPCCQNMTDGLGLSLLHLSARKGNVDVTKGLIVAGVDVNFANKQGWRPLHEASRWGHVRVVDVLLSAGAHVNAADKGGNTALHAATLYFRLHTIEELIHRYFFGFFSLRAVFSLILANREGVHSTQQFAVC